MLHAAIVRRLLPPPHYLPRLRDRVGRGRLRSRRVRDCLATDDSKFTTAKTQSLHPGYRLLHILVHIDGTVDHYQPDHRDRDKPNNQRSHVSSLTPQHCVPLAEQPEGGTVHARATQTFLPTPAKRGALSGKASVEPEHWSMAPLPAKHDPIDAWKAFSNPNSCLAMSIDNDHATQQRIASVDQSWCLRCGQRGINLA